MRLRFPWLTVLASFTDSLLDKGVGEEEGVDDDETETSERVESESEGSECGHRCQENKEEQESELCMRDNRQVSMVIFLL